MRQVGVDELKITPEMKEAGAEILRESLDASYYWSRGVASEVFRVMMAVARRDDAQTP
jgi:hypothetical protein